MASNKERFQSMLRQAIKAQMASSPERFADFVLKDKNYPKKFSEHMMSKLGSRSVIAINDTVALAMDYLDRPATLKDVYGFLKIELPTPLKEETHEAIKETKTAPPPARYNHPPAFRGC